MVRVDLEDASPPPPSINIQSTDYHILPSGNLGSSSRVLNVPASPQHNDNFDSPVLPVNDPSLWNDDPWLEPDSIDPAYLEHLNVDFVASRRPRLYVSSFWRNMYLELNLY